MSRLVRLTFLSIASLLLATTAIAAPKTFSDIGSDPGKTAKKVWFGPDHADFRKIGDIGAPQKVGLLSFYLFDTGTYEFNAMAATYGSQVAIGLLPDENETALVRVSESWGLDDRAANIYATLLANKSVPMLKEVFAENGMTLLTPAEFIQNEAQLHAYKEFRLPETGFQKFTQGALNFLDKNPHANGAAHGFRLIPTHIFSGNRESLRALEHLRQSLELDAFVVIVNNSVTNKKQVAYTGSQMLFYGPNPVPFPDHKLKQKYWTALIPYPSGTYGKGFKGLPLFHNKEKKLASLEGYDVVVAAIASSSIAKMNKAIAKSK